MKSILYFCILLSMMVGFSNHAHALGSNVTWDGGGNSGNCPGTENYWSCRYNWSGDAVPGASDIATFDSTSVKDAVWDAAGPATIANLAVDASYTGKLTMGRSVSIGNNWTFNGSNFDAGTYNITMTGNSETFTTTNVNYYDLTVNNSNPISSFTLSGTANVTHNLNLQSGTRVVGGAFNAFGDINVSANFGSQNDSGGVTPAVNIVGMGVQNISGVSSGKGGRVGNITINKNSGKLIFSGNFASGNINLIKGYVDATTSQITLQDYTMTPTFSTIQFYDLIISVENAQYVNGVILASPLYVKNNLVILGGKLDTSSSNYPIYTKNLIISTTYGGMSNSYNQLKANSSSIVITGNFTYTSGTGTAFTYGTSTVSFQGANQNLNIGSTAVTFYNLYKLTNTADTFTINSGANITIAASGTMRLWGKPEGNTLSVVSSTPGSAYNITKTGNWEAEYANISDMKVTSSVTASASSIGTGTSNVVVTKEFISTIRSSGGDYTTLSAWEAAVNVDLTAATTRVFSYSSKTGTLPDNSSVTGGTSGATATLVHASTNNQILLKSISGTFQNGEQVRIDGSNYVVISDAGYGAIASAYPYNDWAGGLDDMVTISGWTTDSTHYAKIYVPLSQRHKGTLGSGGFYMKSTSGANVNADIYVNDGAIKTVVDGVKIERTSTNWAYGYAIETIGVNNIIKNCLLYQSSGGLAASQASLLFLWGDANSGKNNQIYNNVMISDSSALDYGIRVYKEFETTSSQTNFFYNNTIYGSFSQSAVYVHSNGSTDAYKTVLKNNYAAITSGTAYIFDSQYNSGLVNFTNNYSSDTTAGTSHSNGQIASANAKFKSTTGGVEDLHIQDSSALKNKGTDLSADPNFPIIDDIDGQSRLALEPNAWSIGADQYSPVMTETLGTADTSPAPVAWYKFDEGVGSTAYNSGSGGVTLNGSLGAGTSAPSWTNDGKFGKALSFDGSNDYASVPSIDLSGTNAITLSFWLNWNGYANNDKLAMELSSNYNNVSTGFIVNPNSSGGGCGNSSGYFDISLKGDVGNSNAYFPRPTGNVWHHYVAVIDKGKSSNEVDSVYVDGILQNVSRGCDNNNTNNFGNLPLYFMSRAGSSLFGGGKMDDVKIFNYALTADQVKREYNGGSVMQFGSSGSVSGTGAPTNAASGDYCVPGDTTSCAAPVGEWKMDEGTGSTANDTSGNGNTGNLGAGSSAPVWTNGKYGKALSFDGVNDYVSSTNTVNAQKATISAWVKIPAIANTYSQIVGFENGLGSSTFDKDLYIGNDGKLYFYAFDGNPKLTSAPATAIPVNQWVFVTGVADGSNIYTYVNGVRVGSAACGNTYSSYTVPNIFISGTSGTTSSSGTFFNGQIDNVRVYNYARTPAQIAWEYNQGAPVAQWSMNECTGTTIHDDSGFGNNGTLNLGSSGQTSAGDCQTNANTAWYNGRSGKYAGSLNFDGSDDYAVTDNNIDLSKTNTVTVAFWLKQAAYADDDRMALEFTPNMNASQGFFINPNCSFGCTGQFSVGYRDTGGYNMAAFARPSAGVWHHYVIVLDKSQSASNEIRPYVDGKLVSFTKPYADDAYANFANDKLYFMSRGGSSLFNGGMLDDVKIFNYALTETQVKQQYNNGLGIYFGS